jgi:hypothetical protein
MERRSNRLTGDSRRPSRIPAFVAGLALCLAAASVLVHAQAQFALHYLAGEEAYGDGDMAKAEQEFRASLNSKDVTKSRGTGVLLVSQQRDYFPEYYLAVILCRDQRYPDAVKFADAAKKYIKDSDPKYSELNRCENEAKKPHDVNRSVTVTTAAPVESAATGPMYALVIGINKYDDKAFQSLTTAESDAKAVEALLRDRFGFETQLLLNAKRHDIISALDGYRRKEESASLLIYYGGHGNYEKESDRASWLPRDAEGSLTGNWILADEITSKIRAIPARHILVISDSCYSGGLTRDAPVDFTEADHAHYIERVSTARSRNLLSSGGNEPVADGGGGANHSVFAAALLKGLTAIPADQFTAVELFRDLQGSVAGKSQQTPQYVPIRDSGHDGGDFVFVRKSPR